MKPYYQDDAVTIYHGDCREISVYADVVITDPPYGTGKVSVNYDGLDKHDNWAWDSDWIAPPATNCPQIYFAPPTKLSGADRLLVAVKTQTSCVRNVSPRYGTQFIVVKGRLPNTYELDWKEYSPVYQGVHPTEKSIDLMMWLVKVGSFKGHTILDPFMGSGTTLRAAKDLSRKAIGIEIEERYCEIAAQRMEQEVLPLNDACLRCEPAPVESGFLFQTA